MISNRMDLTPEEFADKLQEAQRLLDLLPQGFEIPLTALINDPEGVQQFIDIFRQHEEATKKGIGEADEKIKQEIRDHILKTASNRFIGAGHDESTLRELLAELSDENLTREAREYKQEQEAKTGSHILFREYHDKVNVDTPYRTHEIAFESLPGRLVADKLAFERVIVRLKNEARGVLGKINKIIVTDRITTPWEFRQYQEPRLIFFANKTITLIVHPAVMDNPAVLKVLLRSNRLDEGLRSEEKAAYLAKAVRDELAQGDLIENIGDETVLEDVRALAEDLAQHEGRLTDQAAEIAYRLVAPAREVMSAEDLRQHRAGLKVLGVSATDADVAKYADVDKKRIIDVFDSLDNRAAVKHEQPAREQGQGILGSLKYVTPLLMVGVLMFASALSAVSAPLVAGIHSSTTLFSPQLYFGAFGVTILTIWRHWLFSRQKAVVPEGKGQQRDQGTKSRFMALVPPLPFRTKAPSNPEPDKTPGNKSSPGGSPAPIYELAPANAPALLAKDDIKRPNILNPNTAGFFSVLRDKENGTRDRTSGLSPTPRFSVPTFLRLADRRNEGKRKTAEIVVNVRVAAKHSVERIRGLARALLTGSREMPEVSASYVSGQNKYQVVRIGNNSDTEAAISGKVGSPTTDDSSRNKRVAGSRVTENGNTTLFEKVGAISDSSKVGRVISSEQDSNDRSRTGSIGTLEVRYDSGIESSQEIGISAHGMESVAKGGDVIKAQSIYNNEGINSGSGSRIASLAEYRNAEGSSTPSRSDGSKKAPEVFVLESTPKSAIARFALENQDTTKGSGGLRSTNIDTIKAKARTSSSYLKNYLQSVIAFIRQHAIGLVCLLGFQLSQPSPRPPQHH